MRRRGLGPELRPLWLRKALGFSTKRRAKTSLRTSISRSKSRGESCGWAGHEREPFAKLAAVQALHQQGAELDLNELKWQVLLMASRRWQLGAPYWTELAASSIGIPLL